MNLEEARRQAFELAQKVQSAARLYEQTDREVAERIKRTTFPDGTLGREPRARLAGWGSRPQAPPRPLDPPGFGGKTTQQVLDDYEALRHDIDKHNSWRPAPTDAAGVARYNAEKAALDARRNELETELRARGVEVGAGVPPHVRDVLDQIDAGRWPGAANAPGTRGGAGFGNREGRLPNTDASGNPITYREWDVNPKVPGQNRDSERIVTGSDGSAWYTSGHYGTFERIR